MPICPRCGKCLSSEQALAYHLNKRYKCGTWKCLGCVEGFDSKFQLQMHEFNCFENREETPSYDILRNIYLHIPILIYQIKNGKVQIMSPSCYEILGYKGSELIGKKVNIEDKTWKTKEDKTVEVDRKYIENTDGYYIDIMKVC